MKSAGCVFGFLTFALLFFIVFCVAGTVQAREDIQRTEKECWYREREAVLLADTREYLSDAGFCNSGVTLNRVVDEEGVRSYTFTIHHRRIDCMDEAGRQRLCGELKTLTDSFVKTAQKDRCTFAYRFLTL